MRRIIPALTTMMLLISIKSASQATLEPKQDTSNQKLSLRILPQNFYTKTLSFTCKKELQVQKAVRMPFYFRLGSIEYVDYLEGKKAIGPWSIVHGPWTRPVVEGHN